MEIFKYAYHIHTFFDSLLMCFGKIMIGNKKLKVHTFQEQSSELNNFNKTKSDLWTISQALNIFVLSKTF